MDQSPQLIDQIRLAFACSHAKNATNFAVYKSSIQDPWQGGARLDRLMKRNFGQQSLNCKAALCPNATTLNTFNFPDLGSPQNGRLIVAKPTLN